jgi:hypothetical protein
LPYYILELFFFLGFFIFFLFLHSLFCGGRVLGFTVALSVGFLRREGGLESLAEKKTLGEIISVCSDVYCLKMELNTIL